VLLVSVLVGLATVAGLILVVELGLSNPQHPTAAQPN
jgi:hypothetical protein